MLFRITSPVYFLGIAEAKWKATITHWFMDTCHKKGLLRRLYTQNIDGLDFQTTMPTDKIVPVHGSMGVVFCENCQKTCPVEEFNLKVRKNIKDIYKIDPTAPEESTPIPCEHCGKNSVKPGTVLYGSRLPDRFFKTLTEDFPNDVDLLIVAGTSLTVSPANTLPTVVHKNTPRLIVNREPVGSELGIAYGAYAVRDIFSPQDCDAVFLYLANKLGWLEDLKVHLDILPPLSQQLIKDLIEKNEIPGFKK